MMRTSTSIAIIFVMGGLAPARPFFLPKSSSVVESRATQVFVGPENKYAVSRWSPRGKAGNPPSGPSMADLAKEWAATNEAASAAAAAKASVSTPSGPKTDYSGIKWSPQKGSSAGFGNAATAGVDVTSEPIAAAITSTIATPAQKDYSVTKWSPQTGATGGAGFAASQAKPSYTVLHWSSEAAPPEWTPESMPSSASSGPKTDYSGIKWSPQKGASPGFGNSASAGVDVPSAPEPAALQATLQATPPKKDYSVTKWSPQTGATGGATFGDGTSTTPAASSGAPAQSESLPVDIDMPKTDYSGIKWSPQKGSSAGFGM